MNKKARDNRANQMNSNNPAYYKSRQGSNSKGKSKTKVVHHHHHHNNNKNIGFRCKCCGKAGKLYSVDDRCGWSIMRCGYCGGQFTQTKN